uniref:NADH dehydrogenase [ubiquinone] 1 alpha subcomplex subunit 13 n=2 Tax=Timema TaxID=61471 RepID=A0A7R9E6V2_9NEOP|nr:unnamed protein product [Timema monikensis]
MASTIKYRQDLPPLGGYKAIPFERIPTKRLFSGYSMFLGYAGITTVGFYLYYLTLKKVTNEELENKGGKFALMPLLMAERDREFLKQIRRNREEEAKLMANVPGWEVGTWYGEPIYKTLPTDTLIEPIFHEYFAHAAPSDTEKRLFFRLWT